MRRDRQPLFVYNRSQETFLAFRVDVADTFIRRMVGLLGERTLAPDAGLWILPCNSVHTIGMAFPIDIVFLDREHRVVGMREHIRPGRIVGPLWRAHSVLELPRHAIVHSRTQLGDLLWIAAYEWPRRGRGWEEDSGTPVRDGGAIPDQER